jgi:hypothetical protein
MRQLLTKWRWDARTANVAHLRATDTLSWRNFALGGLSAVLGAIVGLGLFASLQSSHVELSIRIAAGATAFVAASAAALWKYLDYGTRVEKHRCASRSYGDLVREYDQMLQTAAAAITETMVTAIREKHDAVDDAAPNVPPLIWTWAFKSVAKEKHDPTLDASVIDRGLRSRLDRLWRRLFA